MSRARSLAALTAAASLAGALAASGSAATPLHWNETAKDGSTAVLRFRVTSLTVTQTGWSAHVAFSNLSKKVVQVGNQFGIAFFANGKATDPTKATALVQATSFSPARPAKLEPGQTWTGIISGAGALETTKTSGYVRVLFGPFAGVPGEKGTIDWITDHATQVAATSVAGSGGLVA